MAKLQIKSETISTFGGIFPIMDVFGHLSLNNLIDSALGRRDASWNSFKYSDVIETLFCNYLCGGDCLENINMLAPQFSLRPTTRTPSPDTVGRVLKSLATENISYACENSGNSHYFNTAEKHNILLLKMFKQLGFLETDEEVTLDFDHPFSFMNENTVFKLVTAMLKNFFLYLIQKLSEKIMAIKKTSRLKKVLFHFICVPAKWIKSGRRNILKLYTERKYYKDSFYF